MAILPTRLGFGMLATLLAFAFGTLALRAEDTPAGILSFCVEAPTGKLSAKQVHNVVLKSATERGWNVKEDTPEKVVTFLDHRKIEATVTYLISAERVQVYCDGYATNGKGVRKGPEQPVRWLNYLKEDITKGFTDAAYLGEK